jgi:hypothetical protein
VSPTLLPNFVDNKLDCNLVAKMRSEVLAAHFIGKPYHLKVLGGGGLFAMPQNFCSEIFSTSDLKKFHNSEN